MKKIILIGIVLSCAFATRAQDFVDNALLFGRVRTGGSARIQALGGTQVSLGGDYSSALSNPAGLGMFNRSEFTISPAVTFSNASSEYFGRTEKDSKSVFNIPGLSVVLHMPSDRESGFMGGSFGASLTRINDFNLDYIFSGTNSQSSIIDYFINVSEGINPKDMIFDKTTETYGPEFYNLYALAYNNYLTEERVDNNGNYYYDSKLLFTSGTQEEVSQRKGAQYQWSLSYGANFDDKFFLGATLGITSLRFKLNQVYKEYDLDYPANADVALRDFSINEDYDIRGSGVNFTVGGIYRPVEFLQIGASVVTPTYYQITDTYSASLESNWNNYDYFPDDPTDDNLNNVYEEFDQPLVSEYNLTTPMRFSTGVSFIQSFGFISADVEFVNYSRAKYKSDIADDFQPENDDIKAEYKSVINYRVGAEYRYQKYRVRGGFNFMPDPFRDSDIDRAITSFSGGVGYRAEKFFVDAAAVFTNTRSARVPYFAGGTLPVADQKFTFANYMLTFGFIF